MVAGLSTALETVSHDKSRTSVGQISLFGGMVENESAFEFPKSDLPEFTRNELFSGEKEMTGLYFSGHPLDGYEELAENIGALNTEQLREKLENGTLKKTDRIKFIGLVTKKRSKVTKKNDIMAFVTAEDEHGSTEIIMFPSLYKESGSLISENKVYVFIGSPEIKEAYGDESKDNITILLKSVLTPEEAMSSESVPKTVKKQEAKETASLYIKVTDINAHRLDDAIALASQTNGNARIVVYFESEKRLCAVKGKTTDVSERILNQLREIMGKENIAVK